VCDNFDTTSPHKLDC